jgi:hypothetical protein
LRVEGVGASTLSHVTTMPYSPTNAFGAPSSSVGWLKHQKPFSAKAENRGVVVTEAGSYLRLMDSRIG